jgi:hypothetical protein
MALEMKPEQLARTLHDVMRQPLSEQIDRGLFFLVNELERTNPDITRVALVRAIAQTATANVDWHEQFPRSRPLFTVEEKITRDHRAPLQADDENLHFGYQMIPMPPAAEAGWIIDRNYDRDHKTKWRRVTVDWL